MSRWLPEEQACLAELRMRLKDLLDEYDPLPDGEYAHFVSILW